MRRTKEQKGITLIALIITIVVLLILAVVAINSIQNDGIMSHAGNTANTYNHAVLNEQQQLQNYLDYLDKNNSGSATGDTVTTMTVSEAQTKGILNTSANTDVVDEYGNKIVVPAGFKITTDASKVTEGIVVEDGSGNQFVWVPVGTVYTSAKKATSETIELNRYTFAEDGTPTAQGDAVIDSYYQELETSTYGNTTARSLSDFLSSARTKGGYYIGRYEAGVTGYDETTTNSNTQASGDTEWTKYVTAAGERPQIVCKSGVTVWDYVTQKEASNISKAMYTTNSNFASDLVNSYAWDTAIVFIQTFSTESDASTYSQLNKSTSFTTTGGNGDEYCNINDMSGNASEWSTEASSNANKPCVLRRGSYTGFAYSCTSYRSGNNTTATYSTTAFRPLLYVGL